MKKFHHPRLSSRLGLLHLVLILTLQSIHAGSATWNLNPASGDWNVPGNWNPATVPDGPDDTATFAVSNTTRVFLSDVAQIDGIVFSPGASGFTITSKPPSALTISGLGITNESGIIQNFVADVAAIAAGQLAIFFENSATAGDDTRFEVRGADVPEHGGSAIYFSGTSSGGTGTFTVNGAAIVNGGSSSYGVVFFSGNSTAASGTFTNNGGTISSAPGGVTQFADSSTGASATIISNGGGVSGARPGVVDFGGTSSAGNAELVANRGHGAEGGVISFSGDSTGGTARVAVFGNGNLDLSFHNAPGVSIGSIQGNGVVLLGGNNLTVGSNNRDTTFSGVIRNGGSNGGGGGDGGSFTKTGTGRLVLASHNLYTGGTTIQSGELLVNNTSDSGTGRGAVSVEGGTLGGAGTIAGAVSIGTGGGSGAFLSPGKNAVAPRTLTIQGSLTFHSDATYNCDVNSDTAAADEVVADGVTIDAAALFSFVDAHANDLTPGTTFTVISNTAATPINGTFNTLPDGSTFIVGSNTFQANYEGGDGNDLTLTVVP